jgi:superfamily II DNA helicase RecQ
LYYYFRKDFRPCCGRIGVSGSFFPGVPILALTATSSTQRKKEISSTQRKKEITSTE